MYSPEGPVKDCRDELTVVRYALARGDVREAVDRLADCVNSLCFALETGAIPQQETTP